MKIRLINLELKNFKGINNLKIDFTNKTNIKGKNGIGKTTIMDSFTWVLFGKDSKDRKNFEIKTLDPENKPIPGLEHSVKCTLNIDNCKIKLEKIYKEKWNKKRGMALKEIIGHENIYKINDIPVRKKEYEEKISEILKEDIFKLVTNPSYFSSLAWKEQRNIIENIIGKINEEQVINYNSSLASLKNKYDDSIENYRLRIKESIKKLNDEIKAIPYRIDECNNSITNENFEALEIQKNKLLEEIKVLDDQLNKNNSLDDEKLKLEKELFELEKIYQEKFNQARNQVMKPLKILQEELQEHLFKVQEVAYKINEVEFEIKRLNNLNLNISGTIKIKEDEVKELRSKFKEVQAKKIENSENKTVCPTCKREFDNAEEIIEKLQDEFNLKKSKEKEDINKQGLKLTKEINELNEEAFNINTQLQKNSVEIVSLREEKLHQEQKIKDLEEKINKFSIDNSNIEFEDKEELENKIEVLKDKINNLVDEDKNELKFSKRKLESDLEQVNNLLASKENNKKLKLRIKDLEEQEKNLGIKIAELEGQLYLCEEFTKTKIELSEAEINKKFKSIKFKLFKDLLNGGVEETCEILFQGVPFSNLNTASQINAGLEVINVLSEHYGINGIIFVDNAESINKIVDTNSQIIMLTVSEDPELKIENLE